MKLRLSGTTIQVYRDRCAPENIHAEIDVIPGDEIRVELTGAGDRVIDRIHLAITEHGLRPDRGEG